MLAVGRRGPTNFDWIELAIASDLARARSSEVYRGGDASKGDVRKMKARNGIGFMCRCSERGRETEYRSVVVSVGKGIRFFVFSGFFLPRDFVNAGMRCGQISSLDRSSGEFSQRLDRVAKVRSERSERAKFRALVKSVQKQPGESIAWPFCWPMSIYLHRESRRQGSFPHGVIAGFKP